MNFTNFESNESVRRMDKVQLLKTLKQEAFQIKQKINKIQDPKKKKRFIRNYAQLISAVLDISKLLS